MIERIRDLTGDHVGLVRVGQRNDDVGVVRAGALQNLRVRGVADDRANVEAILEFPQHVGTHVDDGDLVRFLTGQVICRGGPDLAGAEN